MLFSSLEFLFLFLPVTLLCYFLVPLKARNVVLLLFSLIFYGWGERVYIWLMVGTILIDYLAGLLVARAKKKDRPRAAKAWLITAIAINLALLGFFKYADFVLDNLRLIPALSDLPTLGLALPIGISFYTFQALSYVIDVYRGEVDAQRSAVKFGTYVTLFPQLIAGPIVRYRDVAAELEQRTHSVNAAASGARTFLCGLAKKVLLANTAGAMWEAFRAVPDAERTVLGAWLGIIFFTIQIYFDFSGYSDMAIGLGRILGFRFAENFYYPYVSRSITDFWRRWHISLSTWFREYVYIPLGGNRCTKGRMLLNLLVTWLLTGFWHGASWNYLLWGLYFFLLLTAEKLFLGKWLERLPRVLQHVYALFFIVIGWLIFVFEDSAAGLSYLGTMLGAGGGWVSGTDLYEILRNAVFLVICVISCLPAPKRMFYRALERRPRLTAVASNAASLAVLVLCVAYLVNSSYNPFLYFRF